MIGIRASIFIDLSIKANGEYVVEVMVEHEFLVTPKVNQSVLCSWQKRGIYVAAFPCLLEEVQGLEDGAFSSTVLSEDKCDRGEWNRGTLTESLEIL